MMAGKASKRTNQSTRARARQDTREAYLARGRSVGTRESRSDRADAGEAVAEHEGRGGGRGRRAGSESERVSE